HRRPGIAASGQTRARTIRDAVGEAMEGDEARRLPTFSQSWITHMSDQLAARKLDPREEHFRIPGPRKELSLFLRFLPAAEATSRRAVLYIHGATFPSALSIAHRFDGTSWRDALNDAGFDVWGLDFHGFGHSDRYPEMNHAPQDSPPLCTAEEAAKQIE